MHYHYLDQQRVRRQLRCMGATDIPTPGIPWPFSAFVAKSAAEHVNKAVPPVKSKSPTVKLDPVYNAIFAPARKVHTALISAGLKEPAATFGMYQAYHETGAFKDPKFTQHNNASGIMYAGQKGATKGTNGYAWFNSLASWAAAMKHEATKGTNPAGATTIEDYVTRLHNNHYFTDSVSNYLSGMKRARLVLAAIPAADAADGTTDYNPDTGISTPKKDLGWFAKHPIWDGVILTVGGILIIKLFDNLVE